MIDSKYPNLGSTRWIVEIELDCGRVVLDDGSQWQLGGNEDAPARWEKTMTVTVEPTIEAGETDFVLRSVGLGEIPAMLLGFGPLGGSC